MHPKYMVKNMGRKIFTILHSKIVFCFDLILYDPSTILQLYRDGSSLVEPVLSWDKCVLLKDTMQPRR